jgi:periplasmic divalent cation tolerance protein
MSSIPNDAMKIILTATSKLEEAETIAERLVEDGLAACVQCLPQAVSVYRWQGKTVKDKEALMIIKTSEALIEKTIEALEAEHSYEVPEILVIDPSHVSPSYLEWLNSVLGK